MSPNNIAPFIHAQKEVPNNCRFLSNNIIILGFWTIITTFVGNDNYLTCFIQVTMGLYVCVRRGQICS